MNQRKCSKGSGVGFFQTPLFVPYFFLKHFNEPSSQRAALLLPAGTEPAASLVVLFVCWP